MKTYFSNFIFFMGIIFQINAQSLVDKNNKWNIVIHPTFIPVYHSYSLRLLDDTLVNNLLYHKIYYSGDSLNTNWTYQGEMLREDSSGRVYLIRDSRPEIVLYDFSLEVNDTFRVFDYCTLQVESIDTIILNNGEKRKRIFLSRLNQPNWGITHWIKGIGSEFGLITHFNFCHTDYPEELLCYYRNDSLLFPKNPSTCFISTDVDNIRNESFVVYPNPFHSSIEIHDPKLNFTNYEIQNPEGTVLFRGNLQENASEIVLSNIPSGLYVIILRNKNGNMAVKKIMKL
jgi:hypothetical protein